MIHDDRTAKTIICVPEAFDKPSESPNSRLVSVMMPFSAEFDSIYKAIQRAVESCELECKRADDIWNNSVIIQDVFQLIYCARIVIVDFSGKNPNVMYETGIAHSLGRSVVPISQSMDDVPFDMRHHRVLQYLNNSEGLDDLRAKLSRKLSDHMATPSMSATTKGIPMSKLEQVRNYLDDPSGWATAPRDDGCNGDFYHRVDPGIAIACADAPEHMARNEEWTRGEVRTDNNHAGFYDVRYNQQILARIRYVSF